MFNLIFVCYLRHGEIYYYLLLLVLLLVGSSINFSGTNNVTSKIYIKPCSILIELWNYGIMRLHSLLNTKSKEKVGICGTYNISSIEST